MREIKFRAWMIAGKYMKQWDDLEHLNFWAYANHGGIWELMQYTGLKDKNGKEIYEGDILGLNETILPDKQTEFGQVEVRFGAYDDSEIEYGSPGFGWWVTGYHGYNRLNGITDKYVIEEHSLLTVCDEYEIIGNIYENPELLNRHC